MEDKLYFIALSNNGFYNIYDTKNNINYKDVAIFTGTLEECIEELEKIDRSLDETREIDYRL